VCVQWFQNPNQMLALSLMPANNGGVANPDASRFDL